MRNKFSIVHDTHDLRWEATDVGEMESITTLNGAEIIQWMMEQTEKKLSTQRLCMRTELDDLEAAVEALRKKLGR